MTAIVGMALGKREVPAPVQRQNTTANFLLPDQVKDTSEYIAYKCTKACPTHKLIYNTHIF